jgi:hypothetical protein
MVGRTVQAPRGRTWVRWWTVPLPTVQPELLPQCPHVHCRSRRCPRVLSTCGQPVSAEPRALSARIIVSAVRTVVSARRRRPGPVDQRRPAGYMTWAAAFVLLGQVAAGRPHSYGSRPQPPRSRAAGVRPAAELDAVAMTAVRCYFRSRGRCPDGWPVSGRLVSAADTAAACGVRRYRNRSPGRRPLDGCASAGTRGRPGAGAGRRAGRAPRPSPAAPRPAPPRRSARQAADPAGRRAAIRPPPRGQPPAGRPRPCSKCRPARHATPTSGRRETPARRAPGRGGQSPAHTARCRPAAGQPGAAAQPAPPPVLRGSRPRADPGEAEVAVRHPTRLQDLAVGVAAELPHGRSLGWRLGAPA